MTLKDELELEYENKKFIYLKYYLNKKE